ADRTRGSAELADVELVDGGVEADEAHGLDAGDRRADRLDRDLGSFVDGVAEGAGTDRGEGDGRDPELVGHLEAPAVAAREEARLAAVAPLPDRPDGVDHEPGGEGESGRCLGVAERAPVERPARLEQLGAGGPVDGAVDATAPEKRGVGRV